MSLDTFANPALPGGVNVGGAGASTHSIKISQIPAAAVAIINTAIVAGNIVQLVLKDASGGIVAVFAAENVAGTASTAGFVLTGDGATNTCDVGSTGFDGSGGWSTIDVKIIQA